MCGKKNKCAFRIWNWRVRQELVASKNLWRRWWRGFCFIIGCGSACIRYGYGCWRGFCGRLLSVGKKVSGGAPFLRSASVGVGGGNLCGEIGGAPFLPSASLWHCWSIYSNSGCKKSRAKTTLWRPSQGSVGARTWGFVSSRVLERSLTSRSDSPPPLLEPPSPFTAASTSSPSLPPFSCSRHQLRFLADSPSRSPGRRGKSSKGTSLASWWRRDGVRGHVFVQQPVIP